MTLQQLKEQEVVELEKFLLSDCRCDESYKDRDLVDPACPWHFVYESGLLYSFMEQRDLRLEQAIREDIRKEVESKRNTVSVMEKCNENSDQIEGYLDACDDILLTLK